MFFRIILYNDISLPIIWQTGPFLTMVTLQRITMWFFFRTTCTLALRLVRGVSVVIPMTNTDLSWKTPVPPSVQDVPGISVEEHGQTQSMKQVISELQLCDISTTLVLHFPNL